MGNATKIKMISDVLVTNGEDFQQDPNDSSFWVHKQIVASLEKAFVQPSAFEVLKNQFGTILLFSLRCPGQLEFFVTNVPGIKRYVFVKGRDLCICHVEEVIPWD